MHVIFHDHIEYGNFTTTFSANRLFDHNECVCIIDEENKKTSGARCKTFQRKTELETENHHIGGYKQITKIQTSKRALREGIQ
jgi:hypothetical protein